VFCSSCLKSAIKDEPAYEILKNILDFVRKKVCRNNNNKNAENGEIIEYCDCGLLLEYVVIPFYLFITHKVAKNTQTKTQNLINCHNVLIETQHTGLQPTRCYEIGKSIKTNG